MWEGLSTCDVGVGGGFEGAESVADDEDTGAKAAETLVFDGCDCEEGSKT
jgi:hypothetical protein